MNAQFGWALALAGALSPSLSFAQATPLPYAEVWGNLIGTCGPQWAGLCEAGWQAHGAPGSLAVKQNAAHPQLRSLLMRPGSNSAPNGVSRTFFVTPGSGLGLKLAAVGIDGGAKLHVRVRYYNLAGVLVGSRTEVLDVPACSSRSFDLTLAVPSNAATAQIFYGAGGGTAPGAQLGFGGLPWILISIPAQAPTGPAPTPPPDDGTSCPDPECEPCNISCEDDQVRVSFCGQDENCIVIQDCYCENTGAGECDDEVATSGSWL